MAGSSLPGLNLKINQNKEEIYFAFCIHDTKILTRPHPDLLEDAWKETYA
jgi:hypothetical protein